MKQPRTQEELEQLVRSTLGHYEGRVEAFWQGTRDHDVSQNIETLLRYLPKDRPLQILDFGCGPGRDLLDWKSRGHLPIGLDGSLGFCEKARALAGVEVWHQDFLALDLPDGLFDGVFANASLFHVPSQEMPRVLRELCATLQDDGVLFASNPRGGDVEGYNDQRYGTYLCLETWQQLVTEAGFVELEHYYRPAGRPRDEQPWLASAWRKV
ncbi:MAG: SAM-dependent methyltransferase [Myxococcales bacterium]|nr:SAM-dependent methyltransferase [Myxococcales bacterium]